MIFQVEVVQHLELSLPGETPKASFSAGALQAKAPVPSGPKSSSVEGAAREHAQSAPGSCYG